MTCFMEQKNRFMCELEIPNHHTLDGSQMCTTYSLVFGILSISMHEQVPT